MATTTNRKPKSQRKYDVARPFRLWHNEEKRDVPHRCYASSYRAHIAALVLVRYAIKETIIEVHDLNGERHIGTYRRLPSGIGFKERDAIWHGPKRLV